MATAIDVVRKNGDLVVHADVPGMRPEEIEVEVKDGVLTISGEHEESREEKDEEDRVVRSERRYGSFRHSISLPEGVREDDVRTNREDDVLEVTIPLPDDA